MNAGKRFSMKKKVFEIIEAAFDLTSRIPGGMDAPRAMRRKGLDAWLDDLRKSDVVIQEGGTVKGPLVATSKSKHKNLPELIEYSHKLFDRISESYSFGNTPFVIGGDHGISIATISAASAHLKNSFGKQADLGVIWVDAHPDLETPNECIAGDLHSTSAAHLLGMGNKELCHLGGFSPKLKPNHLIYVGLRDVVLSEKKIIHNQNIEHYTTSDIDLMGMHKLCRRIFARMEKETSGFVVSFDIDALDPTIAPGVQYKERGGLTFREARTIMEFAAQSPKLMGLEIVEVMPNLDEDFRTVKAANELVWVGLGGRII